MSYISNYFANIPEQWQWIVENPEKSWSIVFNLILLETLLSVDNAAVIATMVMDLPESQRPRALRYGILGAYVFRGLALIFAIDRPLDMCRTVVNVTSDAVVSTVVAKSVGKLNPINTEV